MSNDAVVVTTSTGSLFAVIGMPVLHSKSPLLHNYALKHSGIRGRYLRLAVDSAQHGLTTAREIGISGLNVTAPFKEEMFDAVSNADAVAADIKAVNTVVLNGAEASGFNTDVFGVTESLKNAGTILKDCKALVLGAGGAARAAIAALKTEGASVTIANRTVDKARILADEFGCEVTSLSAEDLSRAIANCAVLINAVSVSTQVVPPELLDSDLVVLESQYSVVTQLARDAEANGCTVVPGEDWLLFQAQQAFLLFTGKMVSVETLNQARRTQSRDLPTCISLVGLMGSGKTTVALSLAELLGWELIEVDRIIEQRAGKDIRSIMEQDGEPHFRALEKEVIFECVQQPNSIISCGGGAVGNPDIRAALSEHTICIWLWAAVDELARRVGDDEKRPLLKGGDPRQKLRALLASRAAFYAEVADLVVPTENRSPLEIAKRIAYEVDQSRKR